MGKQLAPLTPDLYVECFWSCRGCGRLEQPVQVKARARDENIMAFVDRVRVAVYIDHLNNSPGCRHPTAQLKMPVGSGFVIGRPVEN